MTTMHFLAMARRRPGAESWQDATTRVEKAAADVGAAVWVPRELSYQRLKRSDGKISRNPSRVVTPMLGGLIVVRGALNDMHGMASDRLIVPGWQPIDHPGYRRQFSEWQAAIRAKNAAIELRHNRWKAAKRNGDFFELPKWSKGDRLEIMGDAFAQHLMTFGEFEAQPDGSVMAVGTVEMMGGEVRAKFPVAGVRAAE